MPDLTEKQLKIQKMMEQSKSFITGEATGTIEPWKGRKSPMVTLFLKQSGQRPGPKGHKTVADFVKALLLSLKGTSFYLRFTFNIPDGSGGMKDSVGTLISVNPDGNLTFACREQYQSNFTSEVAFVERANKTEISGLAGDEAKPDEEELKPEEQIELDITA